MLGLGSSTAVDPARYSAAAAAYDRTLPFEGSYIYFEEPFTPVITADFAAYPTVIESWDTITLDDTVLEAYTHEAESISVYNENANESTTGSGIWGKYKDMVLGSIGDTFTLTGSIVRADTNLPWDGDDTTSDGFIYIRITSLDTFKVYMDLQNTSDITSSEVGRVNSDGTFSVSKQITRIYGTLTIEANDIGYVGGFDAVDEPRVRIKNLRLTKS